MKHTMMKVLSVVMALTMIMGTFGMVVFATECEHENCAETKVPATCGTYGYTLYECEDCGYSYAANLIAKADECNPDSAVEIPAVEAQCGPNGHGAYTEGAYCSDCGAIVDEPDYIEGSEIECVPEVVLIPATCDKPYNEFKLVCSVCETEYQTVNLDDYPYADWGNHLFDGDGKHNYAYEITVEPTCVKNGVAVVTCEQCDIEPIEIRVLKNDTLHNWVDVSVKATCTTDGKLGFVCDNEGCDEVAGKDAVTGEIILGGRIKDLFKTNHNIVEITDVEDLTDDCTKVFEAATCTRPGFKHWYCSNEGCLEYSKIQHEVIAPSHQWPFVEENGEFRVTNFDFYEYGTVHNCTTDRIDTYSCMVCGTEKTRVGAPATGHNTTYTYSCGVGCAVGACNDCTHANRTVTKACLNANCPVTDVTLLPDPKAPVKAAAHAWEFTGEVAGTCVSLAYKTGYCTNAGCTQTLAAHAVEILGTLNPAAHADANLEYRNVVAPTCSKDGSGELWCDECCTTEWLSYVISKDEHVADIRVSKTAQEATCKDAGWTKEEKCFVCNEVKTASEPTPKLTECKVITKDVMLQAGTCSTPAKWTGHCEICGAQYASVDGEKDANNHVVYNADGTTKTALVYVPYKAPTCTEDGNHAYIKCAACEIADDPATTNANEAFVYVKAISADKFDATKTFEDITLGFGANDAEVDDCDCADHTAVVIAKLGHDLDTYAAQAETCTTPGMIGGEVCKRCDYKSDVNAGKVIAPHGKFNGTSYEFDPNGVYTNANGETFYNYVIAENKLPTCTEEGENAGNYCMICLKGQLDTHVAPKADHVDGLEVVLPSCTTAGYTVHFCVNCETILETTQDANSVTGVKEELVWYIDGYTKALGHDFTEVIDIAGDCVTASKTGLGCSRCDAETDVEYGEAPKGHKVGSEYIDISCAGIVAYLGTQCSACHQTISLAHMTHNIATGIEEATCTETGKLIYACVDCGLHFVDAEGSALTAGVVAPDGTVLVEDGTFAIETPALGHKIGLVVELVLPTNLTTGYVVFQCAVCGENMEAIELDTDVYESELGLNLEVSPYNSVIGKYEGDAVNTGKIAVTLTMDAAEFEYKILNLKFGFDTDKLTFAGYTVNYEFEVTQAVETKAYATGGYVNVISRSTTPVAVEEVAPNVVIDGEDVEFITLFFTVKRDMAPHNEDFDFDFVSDVDNAVWIVESAIEFMVETEDDGLVNKTETCDFTVNDDFDLYVWSLGDVSMDDEINLGDLVALTDLLYSADAEYCPTADINRDGVVNIVDIALLENYLLTNRTYDDYIAMVD